MLKSFLLNRPSGKNFNFQTMFCNNPFPMLRAIPPSVGSVTLTFANIERLAI
jgi:hypothetical protein